MKVDVVVVGSGVAGLTAAAILAKKGKEVCVVEKQPNFGGALRQFKRKKISYDVGFHYTGCLGEGEMLDILWRYCGVRSKVSVIPLTPDGYDHFEFREGKKSVRGYFSYERLAEELRCKFPLEQKGINQYFAEVKKICSDVPFYHPHLPLIPFLRGYKSRPRSLAAFLGDITDNNQLKAILAAPAFLYGVPIDQASLEVHALVAHGYYSGAYTIAGGGQPIVDAFVSTLLELGVELFSDRQVIAIEAANSAVSGVELADGEKIACSEVIYTGHPASIVGMVPQSVFRPAYRTRLRGLKNSLSMFAVFCQSDKRLDPLNGPLNYYLLPDSKDVIPSSSDTPQHLRPMMMTGTRRGPDENMQTVKNGIILLGLGFWQDIKDFAKSRPGQRPQEYEELKSVVGADMIRDAEKRWGHLCGELESLAIGSPLTFRDELSAPDGCAYGAMHCLDQFNPDVRTRLSGLYLSGQSILMTGVAGASISGLVAAGEILGLEALWKQIRRGEPCVRP